jgi:hypothetical protein
MGMTVEISADSNVLRVVAKGEFELNEAKQNFVEILKAKKDNNIEKVLFDGRGITGEPGIIERFYYGEFTAASVRQVREQGEIPISPKFAYVLLPPVLDEERLGETVAVNRGLNVKAFDNLDDATAWLEL